MEKASRIHKLKAGGKRDGGGEVRRYALAWGLTDMNLFPLTGGQRV